MVVFEVPTGIVADTVGRRISFLIGTVTLSVTTLLYVMLWQIDAPFCTVGDRLDAARSRLHLLLGRGGGVAGRCARRRPISMETGVCLRTGPDRDGGGDADRFGRRRLSSPRQTSLGVPFVLRAVVLLIMFVLAFVLMRRHRLHASAGGPASHARSGAMDLRRLDRVRMEGAGGQVDDARGDLHREELGSTRSTPCSPICWSSTAIPRRTG